MFKMVGALGMLTPFLCTLPAGADELVSQAGDFAEFEQQFCDASREGEHIFVVPAAVFSEQESVTCEDGESTLRTSEPEDDPGHVVFNIDPPHGVEMAFDCDGKADIGMATVALNCLPASAEQAGHEKT